MNKKFSLEQPVRPHGLLLSFVVKCCHTQDLEAASSGRCTHHHFVTFFLAHQTLAYGRGRRNQTILWIALLGCDEAVRDLFIPFGIIKHQC